MKKSDEGYGRLSLDSVKELERIRAKHAIYTTEEVEKRMAKLGGIGTICSYDRGFDRIKSIKRQEP